MRTIGVVTVGRSDYGIYTSILKRLRSEPSAILEIYVSGMHLSEKFGNTYQMVEADGYENVIKIPSLDEENTPVGVLRTIGRGLNGFADHFQHSKPDLLVILGDRFDMYAAALAALPFHIPVAHIHGGELTYGAIDDSLRHSMTKLSHLHFPSCEFYAQRIIQMGEEPWRVVVSGAPALDSFGEIHFLTREELSKRLGFDIPERFLLATLHSETMNLEGTENLVSVFLDALHSSKLPVVFTMSNADPGGNFINETIQAYVSENTNSYFVSNLGTEGYFSMMKYACAMVGNSSSGIGEALLFELPVVNIGDRQAGRIRTKNVIDSPTELQSVIQTIQVALSPEFKESLVGMVNPFKKGDASEIIVDTLLSVEINSRLFIKKFYDYSSEHK